jgi:hypothetical protein
MSQKQQAFSQHKKNTLYAFKEDNGINTLPLIQQYWCHFALLFSRSLINHAEVAYDFVRLKTIPNTVECFLY